jgi:hypothetical protein
MAVMSARTNRLIDREVIRITKPAMHPDGAGLYLQVTASVTGLPRKSWIFRYKGIDGKEHKPGLGSLITIDFDEVREKARQCRQWRLDGIDPKERLRALRKPDDGRTFKDAFFALARYKEQSGDWGQDYADEQYRLWKNEIARAIGKLDDLRRPRLMHRRQVSGRFRAVHLPPGNDRPSER